MTIFLIIFAFVFTLVLVIGLHELGHALAAKYFGEPIKRISIGFGKALFSFKSKHGIEWVWGRWPLGGYVQLLNPRITPIYKRIILLLSGALMNILIAFIAFTMVFMLGYSETRPIIHEITPKSIASHAGLHQGDTIIAINHQKTPGLQAVGMAVIQHLGEKNISITVKTKKGNIKQKQLDFSLWEYHRGKNALLGGFGISIDTKHIKPTKIAGTSLTKASIQAIHKIKQLTCFFFTVITQLVTGHLPLALLLGPIGLIKSISIAFLEGLSVFSNFIGTLSMAVAVANLLPIPGLDGGSILYALIEKIRKKPISIAFEALLQQLAFIAFCVFMIQLIVNDLM